MENCLFCDIVQQKTPHFVFWENENFIAFLDQNPVTQGHTLLIPKKHDEYIFDMEDDSYSEIFSVAKKLAPVLKQITSSKRIGLEVSGFQIPHVHIHLIPMNKDQDMLQPAHTLLTDEQGAKFVEQARGLLNNL